MHGKYILPVLLLILIIHPSAASTKVIAAGAPVFIGESNLDLNRALDNCRIIAWWAEGSDMNGPGTRNITLRPLNEISTTTSHYTISPTEYTKYTGTWYCEEKKPRKPVFIVQKPEVRIYVWDVDKNLDISGSSTSPDANITYRIETNMDAALQEKYRPEVTPADSFWTVALISPSGKSLSSIYTGNYGVKDATILSLETTPFISSSPFVWNYWKSGRTWNLASKNLQGDRVYPPGIYRFNVTQNLNGMADSYKSAGVTDTSGILSDSAEITILAAAPATATPAATMTAVITPGRTTLPATVPPVAATIQSPSAVISTPVPTKTVYQPLPLWISCIAIGIAIFAGTRRKT